jgi:hypothetical protein
MSFREKSAWACLVTTVLVFVPYFGYVFRLYAVGELSPGSIIAAFLAVVMVQSCMNIAAHIVFAIQLRQSPKDERDRLIESRSFRNAYLVLACSTLLLMMAVVLLAKSISTDPVVSAVVVSQVVFLSFVVAELIKYLTQAISYRQGG